MLKNLRRYMCSIGIVFVFLFPAVAFAAPICPVPVKFTQPNGDVITVTRYGDEFFSWQEDGDSNVIVYDKESNSYKYAAINNGKIVPTSQDVSTKTTFKPFLNDIFSHKIQREDVIPLWENVERIDYSKSDGNDNIQLMAADEEQQKPLTHQKLLTILIEFEDAEIKYGGQYWHDKMFDTTSGKLSVVNYWKENANGADIFEPFDTSGVSNGRTGTISYNEYTDIGYTITKCPLGVVKVKLNMPHPSPTGDEDENGVLSAVNLSVRAIEDDFDFTVEQPHIVTIFAGYGGEKPLGSEDKGHVDSSTSFLGITTSTGIYLGRYTLQGELLFEDVPRGIGSFCHELGHSVFSLPDLYFSGMYGPNCGVYNYSLMSYGSHGRRYKPRDYSGSDDYDKNDYGDPYARYDGHVPAHLDPWCKIKCGFITPIVVDDWEGEVNCISDMGNGSKYNVLKVQSKADPKQYFLIENRQLVEFDKGLEEINYPRYEDYDALFNGGILIYHIDENVDCNYNNDTNKHRFMNVERSNNGDGSKMDDSLWVYLNTAGRNKFNAQTAPNSNFHMAAALKGTCSSSEDCHPQIIKSGISIEVLSESNPSMQVRVSVEDEYKIKETGEKFSEVFRDRNFCNAVIQKLESEDEIERNPDDVISAEDWSKILSIESLVVNDCNIEDLTGIEHFSKLSTLACNNNQLTTLDLSKNLELINIHCKNNKLTQLNVSNCKSLLYLYCENNLLKNIDVSENRELTWLYCSGNQIERLNLKNNLDLTRLHCYDNYMNENYELSIDKSDSFDEAFGTSESYKFKYLPQKSIEEICTPSPSPTAEPSPTPTVEPSPTPTIEPTPEPTSSPMPTDTPPDPTSEPRCAVTTKAATDVEQNTAVLNGELEIYNPIAKDELRYCFWKDGSDEIKMVYGSKTTVPPYQGRIYGLEPGTKYYYYAYNGDVKGETLSFTTLSSVTPPNGYTYPYRIVSDSISGDMRSIVIERYKTTSDVAVICASYDERGALSGIEVKTLSGGDVGILDAEFTAAKNQRVFVWENTVSMKPLAEVYKIKSEQK